jgi:hypothetical protein
LTIAMAAALHVPDEPTVRAEQWLAAVHEGREFERVLTDDNGIVPWLWSRWRSLASNGMNEEEFGRIVLDYRRELWLWLVGDRTWVQCCSGLIGRITRRVDQNDPARV